MQHSWLRLIFWNSQNVNEIQGQVQIKLQDTAANSWHWFVSGGNKLKRVLSFMVQKIINDCRQRRGKKEVNNRAHTAFCQKRNARDINHALHETTSQLLYGSGTADSKAEREASHNPLYHFATTVSPHCSTQRAKEFLICK